MRTIACFLAAALMAVTAAPAAAETRIGVVNIGALMRDAPLVQAAGVRFKSEFQKREDELKAEGKRLEDDIARFRREADVMSPQQRTSTQNELNTRKTNFEIKQRQFSEQAQARNAELEREILEMFGRAIEAVAKDKNLDLVLRDAAYFAPALDITADVMKKLSAAPPPAADSRKKKK
jgi:outer membrane protein